MGHAAITVDKLGKQYRIGLKAQHDTLRDQLAVGFTAIARSLAGRGRGAAEAEAAASHFWALRDVSFEVQPGEVLGVIGRNGAGKSTLLKILSQITDPTEGEVHMRGRVASLLEVGTGFHPELTGRENIFMNGAILGMRRREITAKFDEIVAFAEVEKFIDTPVKHYSSGMYVRLAFAVAAHLEPEILIVDEVLAVGDSGFQRKCMQKMRDVSTQGGRTVLLVSHNMAAIQHLCMRALLLKSGRVVAIGPVAEALEHYAREYSLGVGAFDPETVANRSGTGRVRITQVQLQTFSGADLDVLHTGQDIRVKLHYKTDGKPARRVIIHMSFFDAYETILLDFTNKNATEPFELAGPTGVMVCDIPKFPLMPGAYYLWLSCWVEGEAADHISPACQVDVESGDFYGTGRLNPHPSLKVLAMHSWSLESAPAGGAAITAPAPCALTTP